MREIIVLWRVKLALHPSEGATIGQQVKRKKMNDYYDKIIGALLIVLAGIILIANKEDINFKHIANVRLLSLCAFLVLLGIFYIFK